jgi:hypothetical protein
MSYRITDMYGRQVTAGELSGRESAIRMTLLDRGAYFLTVDHEGTILVRVKLIRQ